MAKSKTIAKEPENGLKIDSVKSMLKGGGLRGVPDIISNPNMDMKVYLNTSDAGVFTIEMSLMEMKVYVHNETPGEEPYDIVFDLVPEE